VVTGTATGKAGGSGRFTRGRKSVNVLEPLSGTIESVTHGQLDFYTVTVLHGTAS
jgi:hypothetical protein